MSGQNECARFEGDGTIARYAAGNLPPDESAAFEDHYLVCELCQRSVRAASGARKHFASGARIRNRRPWMIGLTAATIATAALFSIADVLRVRRLGEVTEAPLYLGSPVRSSEDAESLVFDSAMAAYNEQRYDDALAQLDRIQSSDGRVVDEFFSGISALMLGQYRRAERHLSVVIAAGDSPFYAEALYYRAKARLQRGSTDGAAADLRNAAQQDSPIRAEAAALLEQMEE